jgi:hypothetical protein
MVIAAPMLAAMALAKYVFRCPAGPRRSSRAGSALQPGDVLGVGRAVALRQRVEDLALQLRLDLRVPADVLVESTVGISMLPLRVDCRTWWYARFGSAG